MKERVYRIRWYSRRDNTKWWSRPLYRESLAQAVEYAAGIKPTDWKAPLYVQVFKGALHHVTMYESDITARTESRLWAKRGLSARVHRRSVSADGERIILHVLVVREKLGFIPKVEQVHIFNTEGEQQ